MGISGDYKYDVENVKERLSPLDYKKGCILSSVKDYATRGAEHP